MKAKKIEEGFEEGWTVGLEMGPGFVAEKGTDQIQINFTNTISEVSKLLELEGKPILFNRKTRKYKLIPETSKNHIPTTLFSR